MTDWGIPDWRDPAAYGDIKKWEFMRWRWEFSRRRHDLRAAFDERAQRTYEFYQEVKSLEYPSDKHGNAVTLRPDQPGFVAESYTNDGFGYAGIPNPRISEQPSHVIFSVFDYPGGHVKFVYGSPKLADGKPHKVFIEECEVAAMFDLTKPLGEQLSAAKRFLENVQVRTQGRKILKRRHPVKWFGYLRTLDAREAGASWAEISQIHPATGQTEQTARDIWDAADALRFNF